MSLFRNMNNTFQESGEIFLKATYLALNLVNNITNALTRQASISPIMVPSSSLPNTQLKACLQTSLYFILLPMLR